MIRPRLTRVSSGTRLTTNLVNDIINRTEYAADLLRQYKPIAGKGMYVEPHYDGTRISYLQPVGGGVRPPPIQPSGYSLVGYYGYDGLEAIPFIYQNGVYTTLVNPFSTENNQTYPYSIRNGVIVGYFPSTDIGGLLKSFFIKNGEWISFGYSDAEIGPISTLAHGTDGENIVGIIDGVLIDGFIYQIGFNYDIANGLFNTFYNSTSENVGKQTQPYDIYENKIVGSNNFLTPPVSRAFIYFNGIFENFSIESKSIVATGIYKSKIVGWILQPSNNNFNGFIYENGNYQIISHPDSSNLNTLPFKIFQDKICGYYNDATDGNKLKGFLYDGSNWQTIMYPGSEYTVVYGIG